MISSNPANEILLSTGSAPFPSFLVEVASTLMVVFMIVGKSEPLFEIELNKTPSESSEELNYLHQFIMFSSLDIVLSNMWANNST